MPNAPYRLRPVTDPTELLNVIRDSLRSNITHAIDGLAGETGDGLNSRDALSIIHNDLQHTLAVIKASKDTI